MKAFLAAISFILLFSASVLSQESAPVQKKYTLSVQTKDQEITGVCLVNFSIDKDCVGTVINEFGVKIFDFKSSRGKVSVLNVISPLNKWYIRKVLHRDLTFIAENLNVAKAGGSVTKKKITLLSDSGQIKVDDSRYNIKYTFTPIKTGHETNE